MIKIPNPDLTRRLVNLRILACVLGIIILPSALFASAPGWWYEGTNPPVHQTGADDYAVVTQGQLKNLAKAARAEFAAHLPGGAGDEINALVDAWSTPTATTNDYTPVNLGQLKAIAKPFYTRLIAVGYTDHYPWERPGHPAADNYAAANIGQVKNLFSFDIRSANASNDLDSNGIADWWEVYYYHHTGLDPSTSVRADNSLTMLQAFQQGKDPTAY